MKITLNKKIIEKIDAIKELDFHNENIDTSLIILAALNSMYGHILNTMSGGKECHVHESGKNKEKTN